MKKRLLLVGLLACSLGVRSSADGDNKHGGKAQRHDSPAVPEEVARRTRGANKDGPIKDSFLDYYSDAGGRNWVNTQRGWRKDLAERKQFKAQLAAESAVVVTLRTELADARGDLENSEAYKALLAEKDTAAKQVLELQASEGTLRQQLDAAATGHTAALTAQEAALKEAQAKSWAAREEALRKAHTEALVANERKAVNHLESQLAARDAAHAAARGAQEAATAEDEAAAAQLRAKLEAAHEKNRSLGTEYAAQLAAFQAEHAQQLEALRLEVGVAQQKQKAQMTVNANADGGDGVASTEALAAMARQNAALTDEIGDLKAAQEAALQAAREEAVKGAATKLEEVRVAAEQKLAAANAAHATALKEHQQKLDALSGSGDGVSGEMVPRTEMQRLQKEHQDVLASMVASTELDRQLKELREKHAGVLATMVPATAFDAKEEARAALEAQLAQKEAELQGLRAAQSQPHAAAAEVHVCCEKCTCDTSSGGTCECTAENKCNTECTCDRTVVESDTDKIARLTAEVDRIKGQLKDSKARLGNWKLGVGTAAAAFALMVRNGLK